MLTAINNSKIDISSEQSTKRLAKNLIDHIKHGDIIFLYGDIGVGKTTFVRFLINHIENKQVFNLFCKYLVFLTTSGFTSLLTWAAAIGRKNI